MLLCKKLFKRPLLCFQRLVGKDSLKVRNIRVAMVEDGAAWVWR